jgi:cell division transport system permease protein
MNLSFFFKESVSGFFREKGSTFTSLVSLTFFFLIFGIFLLVTYNLYTFSQKVKSRMEIDVYLQEGLTQKETSELKDKIIKLEGVDQAVFRSKEKALQELKGYLGQNILEGLESNPLPSTWVVKLKPTYQILDKMEKVSTQLKKMAGVEEVDYGRFWVGKLESVFKISLWINLALGVFMVSGSLFTMMQTLGNIRRSRAEELKLFSLLGVGSRFSRKIFLFEGIINGTVSAFLSLLVLYLLFNLFSSFGFELSFLPLILSVAFILFGFLLGGFAGLLSGAEKTD